MSKVTVKKNLIIFHNPGEWSDIYAMILRDFGMRMGFTYRHHQGLVANEHPYDGMHYEQQVHVDFFSEAAQSWFQLKYLNRPTGNEEVVH